MLKNFDNIFPYGTIILVIVSIIQSTKYRNHKIEKRKAWTVFRRTKKSLLFLAIIQSPILLYLQFTLYPVLINAYNEINSTSFLLKIAPYSTFIIIPIVFILALYAYFSKSIEQEFEENLKQYKDDAMIRVRDLTSKKLQLLFYLLLGLPFLAITLFWFLPTFQLLSSIK